jgi:hypothetical protein
VEDGEKMKKHICALTSVVLVLAVISPAFALLDSEEHDILKGLDAVSVEVKRLRLEIERDGLFISTLQTDVELMLRMAGMKVLPDEEAAKNPNSPCLYLNLDAIKSSLGYVYRIQISLRERVTLVRKPVKVMGTTFRTSDRFVISPYLSEVREDVREVVDEFIKAWMKANSK